MYTKTIKIITSLIFTISIFSCKTTNDDVKPIEKKEIIFTEKAYGNPIDYAKGDTINVQGDSLSYSYEEKFIRRDRVTLERGGGLYLDSNIARNTNSADFYYKINSNGIPMILSGAGDHAGGKDWGIFSGNSFGFKPSYYYQYNVLYDFITGLVSPNTPKFVPKPSGVLMVKKFDNPKKIGLIWIHEVSPTKIVLSYRVTK
jgi:hypothetical protein